MGRCQALHSGHSNLPRSWPSTQESKGALTSPTALAGSRPLLVHAGYHCPKPMGTLVRTSVCVLVSADNPSLELQPSNQLKGSRWPDPNDIEFICELLDTYTVEAWRMSVAADDPDDAAYRSKCKSEKSTPTVGSSGTSCPQPSPMRTSARWRPSSDTVFPPLYRAYLQARLHLFDQVQSRRFDQQILAARNASRQALATTARPDEHLAAII